MTTNGDDGKGKLSYTLFSDTLSKDVITEINRDGKSGSTEIKLENFDLGEGVQAVSLLVEKKGVRLLTTKPKSPIPYQMYYFDDNGITSFGNESPKTKQLLARGAVKIAQQADHLVERFRKQTESITHSLGECSKVLAKILDQPEPRHLTGIGASGKSVEGASGLRRRTEGK